MKDFNSFLLNSTLVIQNLVKDLGDSPKSLAKRINYTLGYVTGYCEAHNLTDSQSNFLSAWKLEMEKLSK